jgi:long-chain fatty acid transport protein
MGQANAGAEAWGFDASTFLHNPAAMTRIEGRQFMVGGGFLLPDVQFDPDPTTPVTGTDGGDQGGVAPLLSAFYVNDLSEKWHFGWGVYSLAGAGLYPDDTWTGRFQVQEVLLLNLTGSAGVAYRFNDVFSLGANLLIGWATMDFNLAVPTGIAPPTEGTLRIEGADDVAPALQVGALFEFTPRSRLGFNYQTEMEFGLSGDVIIPSGASTIIDLEMPFVSFGRLGYYQEFNDTLTFLATIGWDDWSSLDSQFVSVGSGLTGSLPRNWDDTEHYSIGFHIHANDRLTWQFGFTHDTSPVEPVDRTADLPMDRQNRFAFGFLLEKSEKVNLGGAIEYIDFGSAAIADPSPLGLVGDYSDNQAIALAFNANWK